jgi:hypothetical protein
LLLDQRDHAHLFGQLFKLRSARSLRFTRRAARIGFVEIFLSLLAGETGRSFCRTNSINATLGQRFLAGCQSVLEFAGTCGGAFLGFALPPCSSTCQFSRLAGHGAAVDLAA